MGLSEYHEKVVPYKNPLGMQDYAYHRACDNLRKQNSGFLPDNQVATFVMGGCHPYVDGTTAFRKIFSHIHPHPQDKYIALDIVPEAISKINPAVIPYRFAADLQNLPLRPDSVNVLVLDFVLPFMSDQQIRNLSESAASCLKPDGLLMAVTPHEPLPGLGWLMKIRESRRHHTEIFPRRDKAYLNLLPDLKLVLEATAKDFDLRAYSKADNPDFATYQGYPRDYDLNSIASIDNHYCDIHELINGLDRGRQFARVY